MVVKSLKQSVSSATVGRRRALDEAIGRLLGKQRRIEDRLRKAYEDRLNDRITTAEYDSLALQWRGELATIGTQPDAHQRESWEHMDEAVEFLDLIRETADTYARSNPARKLRILQAVLSNPRIRDGKVEADLRQPFCYVAVAAARKPARVRRPWRCPRWWAV